MRLLVVLMLCVALARALDKVEIDKNEFAEFDLEEEDLVVEKLAPEKLEPQEADEDEVKVEEEDFDHYQDEEEFEGVISDNKPSRSRNPEKPDLKITKVPLHFRRHWEHFYLELLMIAGLVVYCSAFVLGRSRNHQLAQAWLQAHRPLLESNFALVGDDGRKDLEGSGGLVKESENVYTLWCSGRLCVEGMLVELKLLKRQDLLSMITNLIKPSTDQINVRVEMSADSMDSFVMCLGTKKSISKIAKEMQDAKRMELCYILSLYPPAGVLQSTYCPEKKNVDKYGLSSNFNLLNEIGEVASAMLDAKVLLVTLPGI
ncbi:CCDC47 [Cordylochernes scorpioides]|uniref:PAT complex subunit CCDC47 n=1 Tax=Cordylochernes scorpioides TaxID=51811 RepID=A0ABY6JV33_9ARAC|nr:CCDC47 [Cordylochernes scorpioides]